MSLRVLAVAPPSFLSGNIGPNTFTSKDPSSLYNACRVAAYYADLGIGAWGDSNWADGLSARQSSVLLMHSLREQMKDFDRLLSTLKPNLLLLGSMTLCFPGAIACARRAKEMFGDEICIVLGGRHVSESLFLDKGTGTIINHPSSPVRLMAENEIENIFDIVVSGDGDYPIVEIGELVASLVSRNIPAASAKNHLERFSQTPGRWIISAGSNYIVSKPNIFDRNILPAPCELFGVRTFFDVFDGNPTAHVYSDCGGGCMFGCPFCSESSHVNGPLLQLDTAADRLFRQLVSASTVIRKAYPEKTPSAFVEDSIFLASQEHAIQRFVRVAESLDKQIRFGGQLTVDCTNELQAYLKPLRERGLEYVFVGLETSSPTDVGGFSKDRQSSEGTWLERACKAFSLLSENRINVGVSLLFGLGESRENREFLFQRLLSWRQAYGFPCAVSMNWAVQHPLKGRDGGANYRYLDWGVDPGPMNDALQDFGEASVRYPIAGVHPPTLEEVNEVRSMYRQLFH